MASRAVTRLMRQAIRDGDIRGCEDPGLATRVDTPAVREAAQIHGYVIGFVIGAVFLGVATLSALFLVKASKADMEAMSEAMSGVEVPVPV